MFQEKSERLVDRSNSIFLYGFQEVTGRSRLSDTLLGSATEKKRFILIIIPSGLFLKAHTREMTTLRGSAPLERRSGFKMRTNRIKLMPGDSNNETLLTIIIEQCNIEVCP